MNGFEGPSSSPDFSSILNQNTNDMNNIITRNGGPGFTFMQMEELKLQALIYKYIEAGLHVPSHLILPIWNSVLASFTVSGCDRNLRDNYRNAMEAEPGRCKRTDGKKWRCSKAVVAGYKYCERHLHRGRNRSSRKDVEADAAAVVVATETTTEYHGNM